MPNHHKPIGNTKETLLSWYEETQARLKQIEDAGTKFFLSGGASLENSCTKLLTLKMNCLRTPLSSILQ